MAWNGHMVLQTRQPEQAFSSTEATTGSMSTWPLLIIPWMRAAAAAPWDTESGMSFGPWQAPAMKTPSVMVATGSSLGWRSVSHPSMLQESPNLSAVSLASARGSRAPMSRTMSTGRRCCRPRRVSSYCRMSLPSSPGSRAASVTSATRPRTKCMPSFRRRW